MNISQLINIGSKALKQKHIQTHLLDSELILSIVLKKSRENILTSLEQHVSDDIVTAFNSRIKRREKKDRYN